jgi:hypothetical protein
MTCMALHPCARSSWLALTIPRNKRLRQVLSSQPSLLLSQKTSTSRSIGITHLYRTGRMGNGHLPHPFITSTMSITIHANGTLRYHCEAPRVIPHCLQSRQTTHLRTAHSHQHPVISQSNVTHHSKPTLRLPAYIHPSTSYDHLRKTRLSLQNLLMKHPLFNIGQPTTW